MKNILAVMLSAFLVLSMLGCDNKQSDETTGGAQNTSAVSETLLPVETTELVETTKPVESTSDEITSELAVTTDEPNPGRPAEFDLGDVSSVEDYYGGDVTYAADLDGDGVKETCTVRIVAHGTQCYVEKIEIKRANGEKIVVEHPTTATGMRSYFHMYKDHYNIHLDDAYDEITYPFDTLSTPEEHLTNIRFGDIFDYSVIGDKLYFRGSLACGYSEVIGDVIYEYTYHGDALKISRIGYRDYIGGVDYDLCDVLITSSLLVEPCMGGEIVSELPDAEPLVSASAIMKQPEFFVYEKGLTYYVKWQKSPLKEEYTYTKYTLTLPAGYTDGEIISDGPGGGSGELGFLVRAKKGADDVALWYLFYADRLAAPVNVWENEYITFTPDEGTRLNGTYAYTPYCIARQYVNADDRVLYYIIDLPGGQRIRYDKEDGAHPPMADSMVEFADVNFDGKEDFCLKLGNFGVQGSVSVRAYLGDENGKYTLCESFEEIPNPVIDAENKQILGMNRESAGEYSYRKFEFKGGEFVRTADLVLKVADDIVEIDGETYSISEGSPDSSRFIGEDGEWELDNAKWYDLMFKFE